MVFFSAFLVFLDNFRLIGEEPLNLVFQNFLPRAKLQRSLLFLADRYVNSVLLVNFRAKVSGCFGHLRLRKLVKDR